MSDAKQMKGDSMDHTLAQKSGGEYQANMDMGPMGRPAKVPAGESPMKAMIEGPFGGKKPA